MRDNHYSKTSDSGPSEIGTQLSTKDDFVVPKNWFTYNVNLWEEDNLSTKDILYTQCALDILRGFTVCS